MKNKIINYILKKIRKLKQQRLDARAGFKRISQREAFLLEDKLTIEEKKHYCERKAFSQLGYFPNLDNPKSYSEKIIWLALHYKNPLIKICADKYRVKKYIKEKINLDITIPTIGIYKNVNDINFDDLPNKFVLKSTAGWGGKQVILVKNKNNINLERTKSRIAEWLYPWNNYYYNNLCVTDENIVPEILIEEYIGGEEGIDDYKIFCFNGKPRYILIVSERGTKKIKKTFIDINSWEVIPIWRNETGVDKSIEKPELLGDMLKIAEKLSNDFPLLRLDFFIDRDKLYVGEMTFSPGMFLKINPLEWDYKLGEYLELNGKDAK